MNQPIVGFACGLANIESISMYMVFLVASHTFWKRDPICLGFFWYPPICAGLNLIFLLVVRSYFNDVIFYGGEAKLITGKTIMYITPHVHQWGIGVDVVKPLVGLGFATKVIVHVALSARISLSSCRCKCRKDT